MPRRERSTIVGSILDVVDRHAGSGRSTLATRVNVAYDRLTAYLVEMQAKGLIDDARQPRLTARGREYLAQYRKWSDAVRVAGIETPLVMGRADDS